MLNERSYFSYNNYSVPKDDPIHNAPTSSQLYAAIKQKMSPCSIVLIMAGKYASYSPWIQKEIKIAKSEFIHSKPVIAITPWGAQQISSDVSKAADEIVKWNTESIITAIRKWA
jgi:hypothetical protein